MLTLSIFRHFSNRFKTSFLLMFCDILGKISKSSSQVFFLEGPWRPLGRLLGCLWEAFGRPLGGLWASWGSPWRPWGSLGHHFGRPGALLWATLEEKIQTKLMFTVLNHLGLDFGG